MKKYLVLLVMFLSVFILAGCEFGNKVDKDFVDLTNEIKNGTEVTIKFRVVSGVISANLPDLIDSFNAEYPNVTIELDAVSGGYTDLRKLTILDIQANQAPTMIIGYPDHFAEYYSGAALVNLQYFIEGENGFTQDDLDDFVPSYLAEGKGFDVENPDDLYSFPFNKSTEVMVYNKTMIDELHKLDSGVVVPTTWQEVKTVSEKIIALVSQGKADTIITLAAGEKKPSELLADGVFVPFAYDSAANAFITMTRQWKGAYTERVNTSKGYIKFDNPQVKAGLTYFQTESNAGRYAIAETFGGSYASDAFKALKTFMTIGSSAGVGYNVPEGGKFEVGVAKAPYNANNPDDKYVIQQGTNVAILAQSTNLQRSAAWLFVKHLMSVENTAKFAMGTGGYFPVRQSSYETAEYVAYLQNPVIEKINHSKAANVALSYLNDGYQYFVDPAFVGSSGVRDEVGRAYVAIIVNKRIIDDRIRDAYNTLGSAYIQKP